MCLHKRIISACYTGVIRWSYMYCLLSLCTLYDGLYTYIHHKQHIINSNTILYIYSLYIHILFILTIEWHAQLDNPEAIVLDCRNTYESDVGRFDRSIPLNTTFFRE